MVITAWFHGLWVSYAQKQQLISTALAAQVPHITARCDGLGLGLGESLRFR
jgi:hypothetical protein